MLGKFAIVIAELVKATLGQVFKIEQGILSTQIGKLPHVRKTEVRLVPRRSDCRAIQVVTRANLISKALPMVYQ